MVASLLWVKVLPLLVVDRDPHLGWISIVEAFAAAVIFVTPEILRIVNVRVMIKPFPISQIILATPYAAVGALFGVRLLASGRNAQQDGTN